MLKKKSTPSQIRARAQTLLNQAETLDAKPEHTARDVASAAELAQRYHELLEELETAEYEIPPVADLEGIAELMT